jgi:hypothetical protein
VTNPVISQAIFIANVCTHRLRGLIPILIVRSDGAFPIGSWRVPPNSANPKT